MLKELFVTFHFKSRCISNTLKDIIFMKRTLFKEIIVILCNVNHRHSNHVSFIKIEHQIKTKICNYYTMSHQFSCIWVAGLRCRKHFYTLLCLVSEFQVFCLHNSIRSSHYHMNPLRVLCCMFGSPTPCPGC